ncbi:MAG: hypothetical protein ACLQUT_07895, partial [Thermoleophilia bacterium]
MATHACPLCGLVHEIQVTPPVPPVPPDPVLTNFVIPEGTHDQTWTNVTFAGGTATTAVLTIPLG